MGKKLRLLALKKVEGEDCMWETIDEKYSAYKNLSGNWVVNGPGIKLNDLAYDLKWAKKMVHDAQRRMMKEEENAKPL